MSTQTPLPRSPVAAPPPTPSASVRAPSGADGGLFTVGHTANRLRIEHFGRVGLFTRSRQLLATGAWRGPRDAAEAYIEEHDACALGGFERAAEAGARLVLVAVDVGVVRTVNELGMRCAVRVPFRAGETTHERRETLGRLERLVRGGDRFTAVIPTPVGEPMGLDTLEFFARCRLAAPAVHLAADFALLGHRLAQMALGFGADQLFGPIVSERALRLGDNANNPAMTRKEAALLLAGAGLEPHERLASDRLEAVSP